MIHIILSAIGPVTPVGIERAVEAMAGVDHAAAVGVGPSGTQQVVVLVAPSAPSDGRIWRRPSWRNGSGPSLRRRRRRLRRSLSAVDKRHNSKIDRTRAAKWASAVLAGGRMGEL